MGVLGFHPCHGERPCQAAALGVGSIRAACSVAGAEEQITSLLLAVQPYEPPSILES